MKKHLIIYIISYIMFEKKYIRSVTLCSSDSQGVGGKGVPESQNRGSKISESLQEMVI